MRQGSLTRTSTLYLVALIALAVASLQPVAPLERAFELASAPTRVLPELAAPLRWLGAGEVRAAERELAAAAQEVRRQAEELFTAEQDAAMPTRPELLAGRRFVHGEVVGRRRDDLDQVLVRVARIEGLEPGLPVVAGDHYVGRVEQVVSAEERVLAVELVTGVDFFVGARHVGLDPARTPRQLVVGGLAPRVEEASRGLELAVHNPDGRLRPGGEVRVLEPRFPTPERAGPGSAADRFAELSSGYLLGQLEVVAIEGASDLARVRPALDFQHGLFHVLVLVPADDAGDVAREERLALETFEPSAWRPVRALTTGLTEPAREGRRFALPGGVRPGAALAYAGHLVGRLVRVGLREGDARLVGDPGARWAVLARLAGERDPRPLGELVALGPDGSDGAVRFRWDARVALGGEGPPLAAVLYTGSGVPGVPRGLRIGAAELPRTAGRHVLLVRPDPATLELTRCLAWVGLPAEREEGAP